jgi:hypothetical protein
MFPLARISDLISSTWPAVGPLVGVLIGGWISVRNQRQHWILDNKRAEYRKLMSTLTRSYTALVAAYSAGSMSGKTERQCWQYRLQAQNVIKDRIFIAKEVSEMGISKKWTLAVSQLDRERNYQALMAAFPEISAAIQKSAEKLIL